MKLWILSDLHLESSNWQPPTNMRGKADVVVLAGDVHNPLTRSIAWIAEQRQPGRAFDGMQVLLVPGNHEYYRHDIDDEALAARTAARDAGVHYDNEDVAMRVALLGINDHRMINRGQKRFRPVDARDTHIHERIWLEDMLLRRHDGPTVVVTHHCISQKSVHAKWGRIPISAAFASNLDNLVRHSGAALWVHGHTHDSFDYMLGKTRVICNPKGYGPTYATDKPENLEFDPRLIIEIGTDGEASDV
jgi:predicted phosphodiesterase